MKKTERSLKEVVQQSAEEKKKRENLQEQLEKLQMKMKSYRKQIEETEEMAAQNLSKFRRIQQRLQDGSADDLRYLSSPRGKSEQVRRIQINIFFCLVLNRNIFFFLERVLWGAITKRLDL